MTRKHRSTICAVFIAIFIAATALAIPECNYTIPAYDGAGCNTLSAPPAGFFEQLDDCVYYFCDENDDCAFTWQKKQRTREIWRDLVYPYGYFSVLVPPDTNVSCCYCNDD